MLRKPFKNLRRPLGSSNIKKGFLKDDKFLLPYIKGTLEKIARILWNKNIKTIFQPPTTIRTLLKSVKNPIDPQLRKGVYCIPYSRGLSCIGEMSRYFLPRLEEHKSSIAHNLTFSHHP